ncbi:MULTISPECIES: sigma-70 family RNA polymerase sigma factor [Listeria]|uniref:sigma-70 family RNA polymerase sigma factor n=1 Tax=Listeria TaxID=1637 RepID=UPI000B5916C4|nr:MULTISPECIES: sigma-70 family RNA polymerase sigma factor [Listeria]
MNKLINEYRGALDEAKQYKANLLKVRDAKKPLPPSPGQKKMRDSLSEDATLRIVNSMIDSLEYAIEYMKLGHEPNPRRAIHRRSGIQREVSVTNVEIMRQWFTQEHGNAFMIEEDKPAISDWDKIKIEDAMSTMSDQEKKIFLMHHESCMSYSQIADELEISIRSVRVYLKRGKEKIQNQVDQSLFCMAIC